MRGVSGSLLGHNYGQPEVVMVYGVHVGGGGGGHLASGGT
jgi:hypothetical protein